MLGLEGRGSEAVSIFLSFFLLFFIFLCYCGKWEISTWINKIGNQGHSCSDEHLRKDPKSKKYFY